MVHLLLIMAAGLAQEKSLVKNTQERKSPEKLSGMSSSGSSAPEGVRRAVRTETPSGVAPTQSITSISTKSCVPWHF